MRGKLGGEGKLPTTNHDHNKNSNNCKVLLVDDEADIIYSIKKVLETNGFVVDSYTDPILALSNFRPKLYDLILLDIKMPKMNGLDLYEQVMQVDPQVKVCFLTASELFYEEYRTLEVRPRLERAYFIQKPFPSKELIYQIKEILQS
jgi:two-component system response regulator ChvI